MLDLVVLEKLDELDKDVFVRLLIKSLELIELFLLLIDEFMFDSIVGVEKVDANDEQIVQ